MIPRVTLREALSDPNLLGTAIAGDSWRSWRALLIAAMGEEQPTDRPRARSHQSLAHQILAADDDATTAQPMLGVAACPAGRPAARLPADRAADCGAGAGRGSRSSRTRVAWRAASA